MEIQIGTQVVAGNVCNLLASLHAASNFFLYCVLSDKYRKTVRELITGYRYRRRHARNNTSLYVPHTTTTLTQINGDHYGSNYGGAGSRRNRNTGRLIAWIVNISNKIFMVLNSMRGVIADIMKLLMKHEKRALNLPANHAESQVRWLNQKWFSWSVRLAENLICYINRYLCISVSLYILYIYILHNIHCAIMWWL